VAAAGEHVVGKAFELCRQVGEHLVLCGAGGTAQAVGSLAGLGVELGEAVDPVAGEPVDSPGDIAAQPLVGNGVGRPLAQRGAGEEVSGHPGVPSWSAGGRAAARTSAR